LHNKGDYNRYEEEDDELKSLDQQFIMHFSLTEVEQSTVNYEISESNQQQHLSLQLKQQQEEAFLYYFIDPIADFLESLSSIKRKYSCQMKAGSIICAKHIFVSYGFLYFSGQDQA
jgi:hypothetical protein